MKGEEHDTRGGLCEAAGSPPGPAVGLISSSHNAAVARD